MKSNNNVFRIIFFVFLIINYSCVDSDIESNTTSKADFVFDSANITCPSSENYQIGWEATVKNIGESEGKVTVQAWLSKDKVLGSDVAAGGLVFGNVEPTKTIYRSFGATVGGGVVSNYNYLLLQIDHNEEVDEMDETNNLIVIEIPKKYPEKVCGNASSKADFVFDSANITCPSSENYQIGWEATVKNIGESEGKVTVQAWLSKDKVLGSDVAAGGLVFGNLEPTKTIYRSFGATVGGEVVSNYNYLLLQIDHNEEVDEIDETNNLIVIEIPKKYPEKVCGNATSKADFVFDSANITCPSSENYQIGWEATVKNIGESEGKVTVQAWLSKDKVLGSDVAAGGLVFGNLEPTKTIYRSFGATVGGEVVSNYNYLLLQIDHNEEVDEIDETNNLIVIEIPIKYPENTCSNK